MESRDFKRLFSSVAKQSGFDFAFGGWFKETPECLIALHLQKSNFDNVFYINIKIYIQNILGRVYIKSKKLISRDVGDILGEPRMSLTQH